MVASPHYLATASGLNVLRAGGSAVDAAIATNAVLAVVTPYLCGLGGDLFAMVSTPDSKGPVGLNSSGRAPLQATLDRVRDLAGGDRMPERGPLTITVPGCVAGWGELHDRYGRFSFARLLADAINYAQHGFPVSATFCRAIAASSEHFHPDTPAHETFLPGGRLLNEGELLRQPRLAHTLEVIAAEGSAAFYQGEIAQELVRSTRALGGLLSPDDLKNHAANWVEPLSIGYRDVVVYELPPNSQGVVALLMLNILAHVPETRLKASIVDAIHVLAEATRLACADRDAFISDPEHMTVDPRFLLSEKYGSERASLLTDRASTRAAPGQPGDTAYMCAADVEGNLVSLIESNYLGIGSGVMAGETGVMMHNRGAWFSLQPDHVNVLAPGKRTMHTLMPAMAFRDGRPWLVFGTMGGSTQPQIQVQILSRSIDQGMPLDAAIAAPRFDAAAGVNEDGKPSIIMESAFPATVVEALRRRGHGVIVLSENVTIGHAHAIELLPDGTYLGVSDPRTESLALGY